MNRPGKNNHPVRGSAYSPEMPKPRGSKESARRKRAIAERKRKRREKLFISVIIFLTFYLLISLFIAGFIFLSIKTKADSQKISRVEMVFDESTTIKIPGETLVRENVVYIPFEALDKMCGFVLTGDSGKITLIIRSGIDYTSFYKNSNLAFIGGSSYRISAPVLFEKDDYYIPLDFVDNYMRGIAVEYDKKTNAYTLSYTGEDITFAGKFPSSTGKIGVETAPSIPAPDVSDAESGETEL